MDESPKYTDLDAETSRKYTSLDSFQSNPIPPPSQQQQQFSQLEPPSNSSYHMNNGYYQQQPPQPGAHPHGSSGYYNGTMMAPAPNMPRYPADNVPLGYSGTAGSSYGYFAPPDQSTQYPPPQSSYAAMQPQSQPNAVNPQYLAQLHSEIEYYKSEVARMYVMPPSPDLAAKIRDFQTRISYLEEKRQYLSMGAHPPQQVAPSYQQHPPRFATPSDPAYMRMNYPRSPGYPSRPPDRPPGNSYYSPQTPSNATGYMYDSSKAQTNGAAAYPQYYSQPYPMGQPSPATVSSGGSPVRSSYTPAPPLQQCPQVSSQSYQMGSSFPPQPSAINQQSVQPHGHPLPASRPQSVAAISDPSVTVAASTIQPMSRADHTQSRPPTNSSPDLIKKSDASDAVPTKTAALPEKPPVTYPSQATSFVSSFVQSAFKSKEESENVSVDVAASAGHKSPQSAVSDCKYGTDGSNQQRREPPFSAEASSTEIVAESKDMRGATPDTQASPVVSNSAQVSPKIKDSSSDSSSPQPSLNGESMLIPSFEPCETLIQKHKKEANESISTTLAFSSMNDFSSEEKPVMKTNIANVISSSLREGTEEIKVFSSLTPHTPVSSLSMTTGPEIVSQPMHSANFSQSNVVPNYSSMHMPSAQNAMLTPPLSSVAIRPVMTHSQPMSGVPSDYGHGLRYPMVAPQPAFTGAVPMQHVRPPVHTQPTPGLYPSGSAHWMPHPQQVSGAPQPPWSHAPTGYAAIAPAGPLPVPVRHQSPPARPKKSAQDVGKKIKKKKKEAEEAIPDSTTSELGEPVVISSDLSSRTDFADSGSPSLGEQPSSSQCDSRNGSSAKRSYKKRNDSPRKTKKNSQKQKDHNEAEGIDVSSVQLASLEMNATSLDSANSSAETTIELPSPSDVCSQSSKKPRRLATRIGNSKKKRRRFNSSDEDIMLPPEELNLPPEEFIEKRRSERNTAKTRKNYITDDLIDYALCDGSDVDDSMHVDLLCSNLDENSSANSVANSAVPGVDSVETSSCSTIAGAEDSSQGSVVSAATPSVPPSQKASVSSAPQLLIPAQIESDSCVVEKILISRVRAIQTDQPSPNAATNVTANKEVKCGVKDENTNEQAEMKAEKTEHEQADKVDLKAVATKEHSSKKASSSLTSPTVVTVTEYFVKYKGLSYLHCEWATEEVLTSKDKRFPPKLKRFKQKQLEMSGSGKVDDYNEEEPFNPDFVEVDRVLDCTLSDEVDEVTGQTKRHFLVKWCSLPYEESTWEMEEDIDVHKIQQYFRVNNPSPEELQKASFRQPRPLFKDWKKLEDMPQFKNSNELRDYQLEGINWLLYCYYKQTNSILADEMGLGKTVQSITFLEMVYRMGIRGPFLIIAPLSTILNWQREFEGWTDQNCIVYHGSQTSRNMIQQYEMFYKDPKTGQLNKKKYKFTALVTTYEVLLADCLDVFKEIEWRVCIIDEAHRLKNKKCKLMDGLNMLYLEHVVLLTGTPLQNNVDELFSLLNFLDPCKFCSNQEFLNEFGTLQSEEQVNKLQAILKPLMLRRLKEDVERSIAPKEETIVEVELTNVQKSWYRAIIEKNFSHIAKSSSSGVRALPNLMNTMMELRKCCNHPFLLNGVEEQILSEFEAGTESGDNRYLDALIQSCGKIVLIDKLLPKLKENNHRVLIFSQMVRCLDIIEDYITQRNYSFERIDGGVRGLQRQAAIDRYSKPGSDKFIFLLCTKAGGLGINLTAADTVIIYDSDWNPQNDLQAQARCHRIGQRKHVQVYRLITRNTYEREMFDRASQKLGLDKAVLQTMSGRKSASGGNDVAGAQTPMSKKEVEDLLKKGAYGAVMEDDDAAQKFCEEDIDQILKKRTQVIKIESEAVGSTFSKASFTSNDASNDIDLNDPNFWEKWAQKANVNYDDALKDDRIIDVPRLRRQTRRFEYSHVNDDVYGLSDSDSDASGSAESGNGKGSQNGNGGSRKSRRKGVANTDDNSSDGGQEFVRCDLYQCEKGLLTYGWGNWTRIIEGCKFRRDMTSKLVEDLCRCILAYALQWYQGDEKIQRFVRELITPENDNMENIKTHAAQSSVAPRGRKSNRGKSEQSTSETLADQTHWSSIENLEAVLCDHNFRKHVRYQCNKVMIRVRTLFFIHHEVIDDLAEKVNTGAHHKDIPLEIAPVDVVRPCDWWDETCDKCLFIGIFKHGYDQFSKIRNDPALCFLNIVGESSDIVDTMDEDDIDNEEGELSQANTEEYEDKKNEDNDEDSKEETKKFKNDEDSKEETKKFENDEDSKEETKNLDKNTDEDAKEEAQVVKKEQVEEQISQDGDNAESGKDVTGCDDLKVWPAASAINNRLRKLIAALQKLSKKQKVLLEKRKNRLEKVAAVASKSPDVKEKWAKREENDFYKTISTFGLQYSPDGEIIWNKFRMLASLNRKSDAALTQYFEAFKVMCEKVCGMKGEGREELSPNAPQIEPITEDRARKTLHRVELMKRIRLDAIYHEAFEERIKLCQPALDMPSWWIPGEHDKDLMLGVASHGIVRSEVNLLQDPQLCFCRVKEDIMRTVQQKHDEKVAKFKRERERERELEAQAVAQAVASAANVLADETKQATDAANSSSSTTVEDDSVENSSSTAPKTDEIKQEVKAEVEPAPSPAPVNITDMLGVAYLVQWPKDRVIIARLEKICVCIETGAWPSFKWNVPANEKASAIAEVMPEEHVDMSSGKVSQKQIVSELGDAFAVTKSLTDVGVQQVTKGKVRGGRVSSGSVHLPTNMRRNNSNLAVSSDDKNLSKLRELFERQAPVLDNESTLGTSFNGTGGIMDLSMKNAMAAPSASSKYTNSERSTPDSRAEDADISDQGSSFAGIDTPDIKRRSVGSAKRKRKHVSTVIDPSKLDVDNINGSEHVAVVDRISGVKIEGSDAPILNNIVEFLYKNNTFDIAPEWEVIVKAQKRFPADLMRRVAGLGSTVSSPESKKVKQSSKQLYSPARSMNNNQSSSSSLSSSSDLLTQSALLSSLSSMGNNSLNPFGSLSGLPNLPPLTSDLCNLGLFNPMLSMFPPVSQASSGSDHKSASSIAAAAAQSAALNYHLASLAAVSLNPLLAQSLNPFSGIPSLNPFGGSSHDSAATAQLAGLSALLSGSLPAGMTPDSLLSSLSQPAAPSSSMATSEVSKASSSSPGNKQLSASPSSLNAAVQDSHCSPPKSPATGSCLSPGSRKHLTSPSTPLKQQCASSTSNAPGSSGKGQRSSAAAVATSTSSSSSMNSAANLFSNIPQLSPNDLLAAASLGSLPFMLPQSMPFLGSNPLQSTSSSNPSASLSNSSMTPGFDFSAAGLEAAQLAALASLFAGGNNLMQGTSTGSDVSSASGLFGNSPLYPNSDLSRLSSQSDSFLSEQSALLARMQKELGDQLIATSQSSSQLAAAAHHSKDNKSKTSNSSEAAE